ncbi:DNA repair protein UVH3-like [Cornus florida]|uniref:DNA repair protein UVH3-like n=1 Tax=Cornus florida TaxID=4283 RepID=UPI002899E182|nr:DNA repair protein UVH3-like [Cornus florida]XP_059670184.1 DNA repair protein UVH3-like [Cornus florida]XP_059670185.1 DNA repair protein UVH3-like [Cornus florida]XP_059670186.1 DNA repair protein UVH3-like [Cornus florida]
MRTKGRQKTSKGSSATRRGRGKGRGQAVGRGRGKINPASEYTETSSNDGNNGDRELELQVEKLEGSHQIRRSTRVHKAVKYIPDDLEIVDLGKSDQNDEKCSDEEAVQEEPFRDQDLVGDAAASSSGKNQHKVGDSSLKERLCGEYLEMGSEVCMDEAEPETETGQLGSGQDGDLSFGVELSKEYLKMGGGFCLDEDEVDEDPDICASSSAAGASIIENPNPSHQSSFVEEVDHDIGSVQLVSSPTKALDQNGGKTDASDSEKNLDHSNASTNKEHLKEDVSGMTPVRFLSAMPSLRRKRRKS